MGDPCFRPHAQSTGSANAHGTDGVPPLLCCPLSCPRELLKEVTPVLPSFRCRGQSPYLCPEQLAHRADGHCAGALR